MFEGKSVLEIFSMGGFTLYIILACSVISLAVIIDRILYFHKIMKIKSQTLMTEIREGLSSGSVDAALKAVVGKLSPFARVIAEGLSMADADEASRINAMERQIQVEIKTMEKYINYVGTIGGTVVYIGLFGTVLGIIRAFHEISLSAAAGSGMSPVITGIAEALVCTASGIGVAVPSVIAFNLLNKRIEDIQTELELVASETIDLMRKYVPGK